MVLQLDSRFVISEILGLEKLKIKKIYKKVIIRVIIAIVSIILVMLLLFFG